LPRGEARALLGLRLELGGFDLLCEIARGEEVRLLQVVVVRVVAPLLRREAPVARLGGDEGFALPGSERRPQLGLLLEVGALQRRIVRGKCIGGRRRARHDSHPALRHFIA
jgi:hypothetical protein